MTEATGEEIKKPGENTASESEPQCPPQNPAPESGEAAAAQAQESPEEAAVAPDPSEEVSLYARLQEAEKKIAENYDLYVRAMAELENARKRADSDVLKAHKFGVEKFAGNLLPVMDSIEKALEHAKDDTSPIKEGLVAIERQLTHALEVSGMTRFSPVGQKFDPNLEQAVTMVPAAEGQEPGTVAMVFQTGWMIHERVLRPAMVAVGQG